MVAMKSFNQESSLAVTDLRLMMRKTSALSKKSAAAAAVAVAVAYGTMTGRNNSAQYTYI